LKPYVKNKFLLITTIICYPFFLSASTSELISDLNGFKKSNSILKATNVPSHSEDGKYSFKAHFLTETWRSQDSLITSKYPTSENNHNFWQYLGITPLSDSTTNDKKGLYFFPVIFYTPDTKWAFGLTGAYLFHAKNTTSSVKTRASYFRLSGVFTQLKQTDFMAEWNIFTNNEDYFLKGEVRSKQFPDFFYGIGNKTPKENKEIFDYQTISAKILALKQIKSGLFLGLDLHVNKQSKFKLKQNGILEKQNITGSREVTSTAVGINTILDTRDNILNPYKGQYAEFSIHLYQKLFGGNLNFKIINAEYRKYFQLKPKQILALQTKLRLANGMVPFIDMSTIGGEDILRSYPKNRFRDHNVFAGQLEYRFPLFHRFGMTTFAGFGDVFRGISQISLRKTKYCIGSGLRFLLNAAERLNVRLDYSYGSEGFFMYASFSEAF